MPKLHIASNLSKFFILIIAILAVHVNANAEGCDKTGCKNGLVCNYSVFCPPPGAEGKCGESGDNKCHAKCKSDRDCKKPESCQDTDIFTGGDNGDTVKLCR